MEVTVLAVCAVVVPLLLAVKYGSLYSPAADDWSYDLATFHLALHGVVNMNHWGTVNAVGQMALAAPLVWIFGPHIAVLNLWTCLVGLGGLLATDYLLRRVGASRRVALAITAALALGPMYSALSVTFMTDIPSYSVMMMALALAVSDRANDRMLTARSGAALLLAAIAFTIREPAGVAFVAVAVGRVWRCEQRSAAEWRRWFGTVAGLGAGALVFYAWRRSLPTTGYEAPPRLNLLNLSDWYSQKWLLPLLALMLVVPVTLSRPLRAVRAAWATNRRACALLWFALVAGPWLARLSSYLLMVAEWGSWPVKTIFPPLGNWYFSNTGDAGQISPIVPAWGIDALALVASMVWVPIVAYLVLAVSRWRRPSPLGGDADARYSTVLAAVSAVGSILLLALIIATGEQMWDRYLFPLAATMAALIVYAAGHPALAALPAPARSFRLPVAGLGVATFAGLTLMSLAYTTAMDAWDGSEWAYSTAFAHTMPQVQPRYIFTNWLWNSVQAGIDEEPTYALDPTYRPCWSELATHSPTDWTPSQPAPTTFVRVYRTWVVTYRYEMRPYNGATSRPQCHLGPDG